MISAGYLYKRVARAPEWLHAPRVQDIHSVSGCVSEPFTDYVSHWKHNGFWFFDTPEILSQVAAASGADLSDLTLFYYEVHDAQFDPETRAWTPVAADTAFPTDVRPPSGWRLEGYDVATFSSGTMVECSPLSCNHLAAEQPVNAHCLFDSFGAAKIALESGAFDNTEPGPLRILAVYTP